MRHGHIRFSLFSCFFAFTILFLSAQMGGLGGCGSPSSGGSEGSGSTPAGVSVSSPSNIPTLNLNSYDFVGTNSAAALEAAVPLRNGSTALRLQSALKNADAASSGEFSSAFCNQKQCLLETLKQALDVEAFLCFIRNASSAKSDFTFVDDNTYHYFSFDLALPDAGGTESLKSRLKRSGTSFKVQVCENGTFTQELVIDQTTVNSLDGINATVTNKMGTQSGQFSVQANCKPAVFFSNASCKFAANAKFADEVGRGNINFTASGGTDVSGIKQSLEANFTAGSSAAGANAFNTLIKSEWGAGTSATGASNVSFGEGGTYPPILKADITGGNASDPIFSICPKADAYCENPNYDSSSATSCPFVALADPTKGCPIPQDQLSSTACYTITGEALEDQKGFVLDCTSTSVAAHKTVVESGTTLGKSTSIDFSEDWKGCSTDGVTVTALDISGVDMTECFTLLDKAGDDLGQENCFQESAVTASSEGGFCDGDDDKDLITNCSDNCPFTSNADQADSDSNGVGDKCEGDMDGDGVLDTTDNCPSVPNADQADTDGNKTGNVCDAGSVDSDGDGVLDGKPDNCLFDKNADQADADGDGEGDVCDPCPTEATDACLFTDGAGTKACATDDDCKTAVTSAGEADTGVLAATTCNTTDGLCKADCSKAAEGDNGACESTCTDNGGNFDVSTSICTFSL